MMTNTLRVKQSNVSGRQLRERVSNARLAKPQTSLGTHGLCQLGIKQRGVSGVEQGRPGDGAGRAGDQHYS